MKFTSQTNDETLLRELGSRLASARVANNLTQAELAEQAGISKRTLERMESGEVATQLSAFIRVCRVLRLVERFELLLPEAVAGPMEQLQRSSKRQRAVSKKNAGKKPAAITDQKSTQKSTQKWTWGQS